MKAMKRNNGRIARHAGYVRFIEENSRKWGPFSNLFTKFHLKYIEVIDFLENEKDEGLPFSKFIIKYFHSIFKSSSMHGIHHITEIRRHPCEVLFWYLLVFSAVICCIATFLLFWSRYEERPTVMAIERDYMNWNVSFPPVTICGTQKINKSALYEYVSTSNVTNKRKFAHFVQMLVYLTYDTINEVAEYPGLSGEEYLRIIEKVTYNMEADIVTNANVSYPVERVITEMGICYAFNWNISRYFSPDYFLHGKLKPQTEQYAVSMFDVEKFAFLRDVRYCCEFYTHDSLDTPNTRRMLKVPEDTTTFTLLRFNAIPVVTSENIRELRIKQRMCRYIDESNLNHFPIYTFSLCRIECKINAILELCQCIPFFYKRLPGEIYCDWQGLKCIGNHRDRIKRATSECDCYSNCEDTKFIVDEFSSAFWMLPNAIRIELSNTKTRLRRNVIYKLSDAIVATGNVCSLFLGVSALSLVEGFYYYIILLPIRVMRNRKKRMESMRMKEGVSKDKSNRRPLDKINGKVQVAFTEPYCINNSYV